MIEPHQLITEMLFHGNFRDVTSFSIFFFNVIGISGMDVYILYTLFFRRGNLYRVLKNEQHCTEGGNGYGVKEREANLIFLCLDIFREKVAVDRIRNCGVWEKEIWIVFFFE